MGRVAVVLGVPRRGVDHVDGLDRLGRLDRVDRFAGFAVRHDPGQGLVLVSSLVALLGLIASLTVRRRRVFVRVRPAGDGFSVLHVGGMAKGDDDRLGRVVAGIAEGCRQAGCALIGGETAEMPGMYHGRDFDLAGFAVGAMQRGTALPRDVAAGDVLLGLRSDGVHSNGFSLVRKVAETAGLSWTDPSPFGQGTLGEALLAPTRLYVRPVLAAIRHGGVHAAAHITGGGLTENLPRVLPEGLVAEIDLEAWTLPPVFAWLSQAGGIAEREMLKTFNSGIGMVLAVAVDKAGAIEALLASEGEAVVRLGHVQPGAGVGYRGRLK